MGLEASNSQKMDELLADRKAMKNHQNPQYLIFGQTGQALEVAADAAWGS